MPRSDIGDAHTADARVLNPQATATKGRKMDVPTAKNGTKAHFSTTKGSQKWGDAKRNKHGGNTKRNNDSRQQNNQYLPADVRYNALAAARASRDALDREERLGIQDP